MSKIKEYFFKPFLLVGGGFTLAMYLLIIMLRFLFYNTGFSSIAFNSIFFFVFLFLFIACYFNFRISSGEINFRKLRRMNQIMFNMPLLIMLGVTFGGGKSVGHSSEGAMLLGGNVLFYIVNLLFTYLILKIFKRKKMKEMEDVIDFNSEL